MNYYNTPNIFESFNARNLQPNAVAETFVPSDAYYKLTQRKHNLVVGPRGSGKTTLLKMLQCEALESWSHEKADFFRGKIDFVGVFIPTDRLWKEQIDALVEKDFNAEDQEILIKALFLSHVIQRFAKVLDHRCREADELNNAPYRRTSISPKDEQEMVLELADAWGLKVRTASLRSLLVASALRTKQIPEFISIEMRLGAEGRKERIANCSYLHADLIQSIVIGIEIFEGFTNTHGDKWALLFDELELAPYCVVQSLVNAMRSRDDRLIFKLSLAPYNPDVSIVEDMMSAMPGEDFEHIVLWYANKGDGEKFSEELFASMLKQKGFSHISPKEILGSSDLPNDESKSNGGGKKSDAYVSLFSDMCNWDRTVKSFMNGRGINISDLEKMEGDERAQKVRKLVPILRVRGEFRKADEVHDKSSRNVIKSSRKQIPSIYAGVPSLFAILEGNPRWFIGVMDKLIENYEENHKKVPENVQMTEVRKSMHKFRALLRTIPCPSLSPGDKPTGVDKALDVIGNYFKKCIIEDDFVGEPHGSFIINEDTDPDFKASLGAALNAGAIVYIPGSTAEIALNKLEGRRFRLTYLLAPHYQMPLILLNQVSLKTIFSKGRRIRNDDLPLFKGGYSEQD